MPTPPKSCWFINYSYHTCILESLFYYKHYQITYITLQQSSSRLSLETLSLFYHLIKSCSILGISQRRGSIVERLTKSVSAK